VDCTPLRCVWTLQRVLLNFRRTETQATPQVVNNKPFTLLFCCVHVQEAREISLLVVVNNKFPLPFFPRVHMYTYSRSKRIFVYGPSPHVDGDLEALPASDDPVE